MVILSSSKLATDFSPPLGAVRHAAAISVRDSLYIGIYAPYDAMPINIAPHSTAFTLPDLT